MNRSAHTPDDCSYARSIHLMRMLMAVMILVIFFLCAVKIQAARSKEQGGRNRTKEVRWFVYAHQQIVNVVEKTTHNVVTRILEQMLLLMVMVGVLLFFIVRFWHVFIWRIGCLTQGYLCPFTNTAKGTLIHLHSHCVYRYISVYFILCVFGLGRHRRDLVKSLSWALVICSKFIVM